MKTNPLGGTGLHVSSLSFGASSLGGVFHPVDEADAIRAVHAALDCGINYFDVAPAYAATRSETILGKALKEVPRDRYILSTKVGKYTKPGSYGEDTLDYSRARIRASLDESAQRLGTDHFDIIHIHDIEYQRRTQTEWALTEGLDAVSELKSEGRIRAVSFGIYPMDLWHRIFTDYDVDAGLVHNHYCLNDTRLLELLPVCAEKNIGIINASPFSSGLLTDNGPADWHPATAAERQTAMAAADFCRSQGVPIGKLALQFASQHAAIPTTMFSSSRAEAVIRNVEWHAEPYDPALLEAVRGILAPLIDKQWDYDAGVDQLKPDERT
jgi:L-galactose dehydrogenase